MIPVPVINLIESNWPAPANIKAYTTTRQRGVSKAPYDTFNLGDHVGDDLAAVQENRQRLISELALPNEPFWLKQVHGVQVICPNNKPENNNDNTGDAAYTRTPDTVCAVLTADCLPVLICNRAGTCVAAVHAGWKSLAAGIIEETIKTLDLPGNNLLAWLGPAIGPDMFEVGAEVRELFLQSDANAAVAFQPSKTSGRWLADIYQLARQRLESMGVTAIYGGDFCTYTDSERFFSYRRDGQATGRMASLIYIA
jgi:polyphenol oxidase